MRKTLDRQCTAYSATGSGGLVSKDEPEPNCAWDGGRDSGDAVSLAWSNGQIEEKMKSTLADIHLTKWQRGSVILEEVHFKLHLGRASGNATTMKATLMNVIAIGYRFKSRSSFLFQSFNHWNVKARLILNQVFTQGQNFIIHALGKGIPAEGWASGFRQSYLLALYLDLLASRGSLLGLLQSSASGLVL